ncbi:MAG: hypothetical protein M0Z36_10825 [Thermaerobacter sp.]|nr:hypothetical protein [Thermaerobacter sp.]
MSLLMMVPYDDRLEPIDEQLAKLIAERMRQSKGTNGYPTKEQFDRWSHEYGVDRNIIASVFAAMNNPRRPPRHPAAPHHLRDIIPVMQKAVTEGITYQITRMEQYSDFSLVYVDIFTHEDAETTALDVQLMLHVEPAADRQIQIHRSQGQANQASLVYIVSPRLPNDVDSYKFALIPHAFPRHPRPVEVVLDRPIVFEDGR